MSSEISHHPLFRHVQWSLLVYPDIINGRTYQELICSWHSLRQHMFVSIACQSALWNLLNLGISSPHTLPFSFFTILTSFADSFLLPFYQIEACSTLQVCKTLTFTTGMSDTSSYCLSFHLLCTCWHPGMCHSLSSLI